MVELMDLSFSIDNVFAAVAFTDKIYLVFLGVFIGILAIRRPHEWHTYKTPVVALRPLVRDIDTCPVLNRMLTLLSKDHRDCYSFNCNVILIFTVLLLARGEADMSVEQSSAPLPPAARRKADEQRSIG